MTQYAFFIWDGKPNNMLRVCLESLRKYNTSCKILLYYHDIYPELEMEYSFLNIRFRKIDLQKWHNKRMFHKIELVQELITGFHSGDKLLVLDCDLLFQADPFSMFHLFPDNDLYYTTTFYSYLIPDKFNQLIDPVNGGVWGITVNQKSIELLDFWIKNMIHPSWENWILYLQRKGKQKKPIPNLDWWIDQSFLTCLHFAKPEEIPISGIKKINLGVKYNFFFNLPIFRMQAEQNQGDISDLISMNIGNSNYCIIHFKGELKYMYQINNSALYNLDNLTNQNKLNDYFTSAEFKKNIKYYLEKQY